MRAGAMNIWEFGTHLVRTGDLDPEYILLWEAKLDKPTLRKWLLAYWCFSHAGTASWIADNTDVDVDYWNRMMLVAGDSKSYKRGVARRYFVGAGAVESVSKLSEKGVNGTVGRLANHYFWYLPDFMAEVCSWYKFGTWAAFKAADMMERLDLIGLNSNGCEDYMLDAPKAGALELWKTKYGTKAPPKSVERWAVRTVLNNIPVANLLAPPRYERTLNLQEVETILCKWHGHIREQRTYNVGDDIKALRVELETAPGSILADELWAAGKRKGLWA